MTLTSLTLPEWLPTHVGSGDYDSSVANRAAEVVSASHHGGPTSSSANRSESTATDSIWDEFGKPDPNVVGKTLRDSFIHAAQAVWGLSAIFSLTSGNSRRWNTVDTGTFLSAPYICQLQVEITVAQFEQIKTLVSDGKLQKAMVVVYDSVCDLLADSKFDDCDSLISRISGTVLPSDVVLSFFMATAAVPKELLPSRIGALEAAIARLKKDGNTTILDALEMCK